MNSPDKSMLALGIRQPWVELILRGIKTVEVRTVETSVPRTIYLYAARRFAEGLAPEQAAAQHEVDMQQLPLGMIVGTVEILECRPCVPEDAKLAQLPVHLLQDKFAWVLGNPQRLSQPLKPRFRSYGIWFYPFQRRNGFPGIEEQRGGHGRS